MKRTCSMLFALLMALLSAACGNGAGSANDASNTSGAGSGSSPQQSADEPAAPAAQPTPAVEQTELVVFAAASMTETLSEIEAMYKNVAPNIKLVYNFDSSGTLKTQIQEGAECDLFVSAGQKQVNELDITADESVNPERLDFVLEGTRTDLLQNKVALAVSENNPANISSFDDMASALSNGDILLAIGNSDVPVGQYSQRILQYFELDEAALASFISYGTNVKEVTLQVSEASVDCGIVYSTDAYSAGLTSVDYATAEMCGQVIYPAAVIKTGKNHDEAKAFLDYLLSDEAMAVFEKVGFSRP